MNQTAGTSAVTSVDRAVITWQLGREPRDVTAVAVRCPFGRPAVIETPPRFSTGQPNPTLLYLTCPALVLAVSRLESQGGVRRLRSAARDDVSLGRRLQRLTDLYRRRRREYGGEYRPEAGIGGPAAPELASCLHAYAAAALAARTGWLSGPELSRQEADELWDRLLPGLRSAWCTDDRCDHRRGARRAAIDIGTISVRLLVADLETTGLRTVERRTEITRLGQGLRPGGRLDSAAALRTAEVVREFVRIAQQTGAGRVWLAGTSALREATDGRAFLEGLSQDTGTASKILTGLEEATFAYAGVCVDTPGRPLVLDIGGGSTELIRERSNDAASTPAETAASRGCPVVEAVSLDLGASRSKERWILSDPPAGEEIAGVRHEARTLLGSVRERFLEVAGPLVGVAGTVTTLACLDAGLDHYEGYLIHRRPLTKECVDEWAERLSRMTVREVAALPCVQAGRASVLLTGTLILQTALEVLGRHELLVSERDLLDGLVLYGLPA